jgi:salicylate hydroxylase
MRGLEIAITGCGPAGLAAALLLHRDGHRVTMFERFAVAGPVGSGLMIQPTGLAVLNALGLGEAICTAGRRIDRLFGRNADGRTVLDVRYANLRRGGFGIGIHRAALFETLFSAVTAAGIRIETGQTVAAAPESGGRRHLEFAGGTRAGPFDLIVDALGSRSPLAPDSGRALAYGALWTSLDWPGEPFAGDALEQRYRAASAMAGVLPIGVRPGSERPQAAFFWSLRADRLETWRDAGLGAWRSEVADLWPQAAGFTEQVIDPEQLCFAHYRHRTLPHPATQAMIHIGDAWHSTSPQLGQGANMALLDAWALAMGLRSSVAVDEGLTATVALRQSHIRLYQSMSALFTPVYQSDSRLLPWLRDRVVGPLSTTWPATTIQANMVAGLIGNPLPRLGL